MNFDILLIVGPTATGKTALGIELAKILDGEIISADSRQIYRHLDIGTAKPTAVELAQAKHYLIDLVEPDEDFDAATFEEMGDEIVDKIWSKGKLPIVVGGSGFYVKALIDGLFDAPPVDEELRQKLERLPKEDLYQRLKCVDPVSAKKLHINDKKRVVRALEIYELTGKPLSQFHKEQRKKERYEPFFIGLKYDRKKLYQRIEKRVDLMVEQGLFREVKGLLEKYPSDLNSLQTVGYQEIIEYFNGQLGKEEAIDLIKCNTRRYAKRQMTWFRKDKRIHWVDVTDLGLQERVGRIMELIKKFG